MMKIFLSSILLLGSLWAGGLVLATAQAGEPRGAALRDYCLQPSIDSHSEGLGPALSQDQIHSAACQNLYRQEVARLRARNFQKEHGPQWCQQLIEQIQQLKARRAAVPGYVEQLVQTPQCQSGLNNN
ncbi:hypothetical protein Mmc1_1054 [Magnetococcus marinus MC-1]|uniref:Secreted protein n=1 Tax=Magnetococcus marinus (strain ATCC BAA-1437 / JCM 17883 / MC-1) TaxID=156889 RepID=A0L6H9_MAGMM|nr:hypothetical protein [Magnetococcus marinus]ABK43572.1 hypothetical protein Mmc1_1054 [Magnetococcus marinus MC-1]